MRYIRRSFRAKTQLAVIAALLLTVVIIVFACGGGGGGSSTAGGGVSGTGRSTGTVTAFGSVFVNGIEFQTTSADITVNGVNATESDLKIGMKVTVEAVNDVALSIEYESEVEGPVSNKGVASFEVLGQTVTVNSETQYCNDDEQDNCTFSFTNLNDGDFVEVSGYFDSTGDIIATLVKKEDQDPGEYQVKGFVSGLNTFNETFSIKGLTVDYSGLNEEDYPVGIADEVLVEVKGTLSSPNQLMASKVEVEDTQASPGKELDLEGIVTEIISQNELQVKFVVNGQPVLINEQTQFEEGDMSLIALNVKVEVEGTVNSNGYLVAEEAEIEDTDIED